jgi:hypothetical protein
MDAARFSETLLPIFKSTYSHIQEHYNQLHNPVDSPIVLTYPTPSTAHTPGGIGARSDKSDLSDKITTLYYEIVRLGFLTIKAIRQTEETNVLCTR